MESKSSTASLYNSNAALNFELDSAFSARLTFMYAAFAFELQLFKDSTRNKIQRKARAKEGKSKGMG